MKMLRRVRPAFQYRRSDVLRFASPDQRRQLVDLAAQLQGRRIVHLNATAIGGGVAEIMKSFVPYLTALGVDCAWYAINPQAVPAEFYSMTNRLHNTLQGGFADIRQKDWQLYRRVTAAIGRELDQIPHDLLVINDPQPLGCVSARTRHRPWIYISHIDTSSAHGPTWHRVREMTKTSRAIIFSNRSFVHWEFSKKNLHIITPAIDPLAPKQTLVPRATARRYLARFGLPTTGPLVAQISRFDVWKNPLGVVAAHHVVHQAKPHVQVALIGLNEAKDNPEAERIYRDVARMAEDHRSLHAWFYPRTIHNIPEFTMMAQNAADIIIQNSTREGFGLTVTEAMWKKKAVIGGPATGIRRQIKTGQNGLIARNATELALEILRLLDHPKLRRRLGRAGRATVQREFLMPRLVRDHLRLYRDVLGR